MRKLEPSLEEKTDEEVAEIRDQLYGMAELAFESYQNQKKNT